MLYFLWTLLNFAVVISFLVVCVNSVKLVKERYGLLIAVFFVFGLFSFISNSGKGDGQSNSTVEKSNLLNLSEADVDHSKANGFQSITIDKMVASEFELTVQYGYFKGAGVPLPYSAYSAISGLVGGHEWKPDIIVNATAQPGHFSYTLRGILKWKLLGVPFYSQRKYYTGFFDIP